MLFKIFSLLSLLLLAGCGTSSMDPAAAEDKEIIATPTADREVQDWNPKQDPQPLDSLVQLTSPLPNASVNSPIKVSGRARGFFFFEAEMPVSLLDEDGNVLTEFYARAEGDWMTMGWVAFTSEISYDAPAGTSAWLRLENNDPSGGEGRQRGITIPVVLE